MKVLIPLIVALVTTGTVLGTTPIGGDYTNIANLNYTSNDPYHGSPSSVCCSIMQMQHYLRTGQDIPRSPQYLRIRAGIEVPFQGDDIYPGHGFSSPWLAVRLVADYGSCPASMCTWGNLIPTPAMEAAAQEVRGTYDFRTLWDIPDYVAALEYLKLPENRGDAVMLSTDGYSYYGIIGVDQQGKGIWLDHYMRLGKARIQHLGLEDGQRLWDAQIRGNMYGPPEAYMAVMLMP